MTGSGALTASHAAPRRSSSATASSPTPTDAGSTRFVLIGVLVITAYIAAFQPDAGAAYVVVAGVSGLMLLMAIAQRRRDVFHPWFFPQAYLTYALLSPWFYMKITRSDLGNISQSLADGLGGRVILLSTIGWLMGTLIASGKGSVLASGRGDSSAGHDKRRKKDPWGNSEFRWMRTGGIVLLLVSAALKAAQVVLSGGRAYGAGQTGFDAFATLTPVVEGLFLAAVLLLLATAKPTNRRILPPWVILVIIGYAAVSLLLLGSRAELIAPALVIAWYYTRQRAVPATLLGVLGLGAVSLFNWVGDQRVGGTAVAGMENASLIERSLVDTSSPFLVTSMLAEVVPMSSPYLDGQTYLEAFKYLLPGYVSRAMFGPPTETASLKFREIIGFTNENSGLGFSLPSEAYLNFGMLGALVIPVVIAWAFARMYRRTPVIPTGLGSLVYPVALAVLPYGIRSDSLGQAKMLLYPLIIAGLTTLLAERRAARREE